MTTTERLAEIVRDWRPTHAVCLPHNLKGLRIEEYGIHCACAARLGWPPAGYGLEEPIGLHDHVGDRVIEHDEHGAVVRNLSADEWRIEQLRAGHGPANEVAEQAALDVISATEVAPWDAGMVEPPSAVVPVDPLGSELGAMSPTAVYTPSDVELQLVSIVARLEAGQHFQRQWEVRANAAALAYEIAHARAIVESDGRSKEVREAEALLACEDLYLTKMDAEATVKAVRESMHNLRSMLSGFQSIARSVGSSFNAPNFQT